MSVAMGELCCCGHGQGWHFLHGGFRDSLPEGACGHRGCGCSDFLPFVSHAAFDASWRD